MNVCEGPLSLLTARLAFQVDRKILAIEEESYLRLDLSAHESIQALAFRRPNFTKSLRQFAFATVIIYLILFAVTNAPAYSKIIRANLIQAQQKDVELTVPSGEKNTEDEMLPVNLTPTTYDNRISIPSIAVNAPIVEPTLGIEALKAKDWNALEDQIRGSLLQGVVHYPGTAKPGKTGNAFFTGHSSNVIWELSPYNTVFALLPHIEVGAEIIVIYGQKQFKYQVVEKKEVKAGDVSILKQGDEKMLTLVTCTPVGTTLNRLAVTAKLIEN